MFKEKDDGCAILVLALISLPVILVVGSLMNGWALTVLWGWFIVPIFNAPSLTIVQAIGLAMVVSFLTYQYIDTKKEDHTLGQTVAIALVMVTVRPLYILLIGWIVHLFM